MQLIIFGECRSQVICLGGVGNKLVDFGESVVSFYENFGEARNFVKNFQNEGGRYFSQKS